MLISVRKLVALDIVFHGVVFILTEFIIAIILSGALALFNIAAFLHSPAHPLSAGIVGGILLWVAINYAPMLLYTLYFIKHKNAHATVAVELAHKEQYIKKYTAQSLLLALPLVIPILAIVQESRSRNNR